MNTCLTHNQQYAPDGGWCPYCGRPDSGLHTSGVPLKPWPPHSPTWVNGHVCGSCGVWFAGAHTCMTSTLASKFSAFPQWLTTADARRLQAANETWLQDVDRRTFGSTTYGESTQ